MVQPMSHLFGPVGPYGIEPPPPPPKPTKRKPKQPMLCLHCNDNPAQRLREMGVFMWAVCYCSMRCAASEAIWQFCLANHPKCTFCDGPLDGFHCCTTCDTAFTLVDEDDVFLPPVDHVNGKEVGG